MTFLLSGELRLCCYSFNLTKTTFVGIITDRLLWQVVSENYRVRGWTTAWCFSWSRQQGRLHPNQYGFRQGRSFTDALSRMEHYICQTFARKHHVVAVFFDIEKTYNTTCKHHFLMELHSTGLCGPLPRFIQNFLSSWAFRVKVGKSFSDRFPQVKGVPQGSVLSCTPQSLSW